MYSAWFTTFSFLIIYLAGVLSLHSSSTDIAVGDPAAELGHGGADVVGDHGHLHLHQDVRILSGAVR